MAKIIYIEGPMKTARQLRPHYGHAVSGDSFWPRSFSVNLAVETLRDGGSIALFGPRRTGKSSIMKEAARILREGKDHHPIEIDLEGRSGPAAFASKLIEEIPKPLRGKIVTGWTKLGGLPPALLKLLEGFGQKSPSPLPTDSKTEGLMREYWELLSETVYTNAKDSKLKVVLFLDELPYFCEEQIVKGVPVAEIDTFLATLRRWRQSGAIPMAIAGSIGIRHLVRTYGIRADHLNDLTPITIEALTASDATEMLAALAAHKQIGWWSLELGKAVVDGAPDLIPSYLQRAFAEVVARDARTPEAAAAALQGRMKAEFEQGFFDQFTKRLRRYGKGEKAARAALACVGASDPEPVNRDAVEEAISNAGVKSQDAVEDTLLTLVEDGFLHVDASAGTAAFAYRLVANWWRSRPGDRRRKEGVRR